MIKNFSGLPKTTQKKVVFIIATIGLALFIFSWNIILKPLTERLRLAKLSSQTERNRARYAEQIQKCRKELLDKKRFYFTSGSPSEFISRLNQAAGRNQAVIISATPINESSTNLFKNINIELEIRSNFYQLGHFIEELENASPAIYISSLKISNPYQAPTSIVGPHASTFAATAVNGRILLTVSYFLENA